MTAYMFAADFHCEECGEEIRLEIVRSAIKKMEDAAKEEVGGIWSFSNDVESALEDDLHDEFDKATLDTDNWPAGYPDAGESDSPCNCGSCGKPLEYSLTTDGVAYVLEAVKEHLKSGWRNYLRIHTSCRYPDYYEHTPAFFVVKDWVEDLSCYLMEEEQEKMFRYIEWMEHQWEKHEKEIRAEYDVEWLRHLAVEIHHRRMAA